MVEVAIMILIVAVGSRTVLSKGCWYYIKKNNKRKIIWESAEHRKNRLKTIEQLGYNSVWEE